MAGSTAEVNKTVERPSRVCVWRGGLGVTVVLPVKTRKLNLQMKRLGWCPTLGPGRTLVLFDGPTRFVARTRIAQVALLLLRVLLVLLDPRVELVPRESAVVGEFLVFELGFLNAPENFFESADASLSSV